MTRVAVVGHVEWVDFIVVERFPIHSPITVHSSPNLLIDLFHLLVTGYAGDGAQAENLNATAMPNVNGLIP